MGVKSGAEGGVGIIAVDKALDVTTIGAFKKAYRDLLDREIQDFILDFTFTETIDSAGVGAMIMMRQSVKRKGRIIVVNNRSNLLKMFLATGLKNIMTVCGTVSEARKRMGLPE